ncbi:putative quinate permease [Nosema granulosis]|uniref:Quinate permease n=1 Tax=Nosema granulosis TaxID=83296 RepID=A0A9P6GXY2_9MICR|nr:putative quinate permease [Nosema granulosis]
MEASELYPLSEQIKPKELEEVEINPQKNIYTYISICTLSFLVGVNNTSFSNILQVSLEEYSGNFFPDYHNFLAKLPPIFYHCGGIIAAIVFYNMKKIHFKNILRFSCILLFTAYISTIAWPHILVIYATRVIIGFATGCMCIIIPQVLHTMALGTKKIAQKMTIFPFFLMTGLTITVALGRLASKENYLYINSIPIVLSALGFLSLYYTIPLKVQTKDKGKQSMWSFMSNSLSVRSFLHIILLHFVSKITGIDLIMFFSPDLFDANASVFLKTSPLILATLFTLTGGFIPDKLGRKYPVVVGLLGISIINLIIYFTGPGLVTLLCFTALYYCGLNYVPFISQNEVVPEEYKIMANELGGITSWSLGLFMTVFIAFMFTKKSQIIWLVLCALSLIGVVLLIIFMKETKGIEQTDFILSFFQYDSCGKSIENTDSNTV